MKKSDDMQNSGTCLNPDRLFLLEQIGFAKEIVEAEGMYLKDRQGRQYLDFLAQYGAIPFGHNPRELWEVIERISEKCQPSMIQPLISAGAETLAQELIKISPFSLGNVTFTNSGAESTEAGIKMARSKTGRKIILSTKNSFHGKTLGALSASGRSIYQEPFHTPVENFETIPFGEIDVLRTRLSKGDVAAFVVEGIQGEGGMRCAPTGYLAQVQWWCHQFGTLFILDEVQTGLGRTGKMFVADHEGIEPDILLLAKALGGGLVPLGACVAAKTAWTQDFGDYHSSTFANNNLTCSVGLAVLEILQRNNQDLIRQVQEKGCYLISQLKVVQERYPSVIQDVRGKGLMVGIEFGPWSGEYSYLMSLASDSGNTVPLICGYLLNVHGILTAPVFNNAQTLRLEPPLIVTHKHIDKVVDAIETTADLIQRQDFHSLLKYVIGDYSSPITMFHQDVPLPAVLAHAKRTTDNLVGRYAFLIHPTEFKDLIRCVPQAFDQFSAQGFKQWAEWLARWSSRRYDPGVVYHLPRFCSVTGEQAEGWIVATPLLPEQILKLPLPKRDKLLKDCITIAKDLGAQILGLGAFTSIVTHGGQDLLGCGIAITSGNGLTAAAAARSVEVISKAMGTELATAKVCVIGATGSLGRLTTKLLAHHCRSLTLLGNPKNRGSLKHLQQIAGQIYAQALSQLAEDPATDGIAQSLALVLRAGHHPIPLEIPASASTPEVFLFLHSLVDLVFQGAGLEGGPISVTLDLPRVLPEMDIVVTATNEAQAFIEPKDLKQGALVCDVARPSNVKSAVRLQRPDVLIYEGGLLQLPDRVRFGKDNILGFPAGINLACLSETIVLALAQDFRDHSIGGEIPLSEVQGLWKLALHHGFDISTCDSEGDILKRAECCRVIKDRRNDYIVRETNGLEACRKSL